MKKILSIDGGGIRGIIPALVLSEIEKRTHKKIAELFDLMAGTSTGGILALGLAKLNKNGNIHYTAQDLVNLYLENGREIFSRSIWKDISSFSGIIDEKYTAEGIERILEKYFEEELFKDMATDVLIPSYDIEKRRPVFFKSWKEKWGTLAIRKIARATSAAPTYFEPSCFEIDGVKRSFIDGGVFINNPGVSAYAEMKKRYPQENNFFLISLGTGEQIRTIPYEEAKNWGAMQWMIPLLSCMFSGNSYAVDYQLNEFLGKNYFRIQKELNRASDDMDKATEENMQLLMQEASDLIKKQSDKIEFICEILTK